ncbi:hypothetical protein AVEN_106832-1 [Araneus ventricosus]|uniref:Uncharacterized protein n=1 Tax=Araneus ventricosus TaxID=182803 RepID=A0A4Y2WV57_ARAVE|nr:hypothetical protein AVEN_106832-1 [Araneus ventricosus]
MVHMWTIPFQLEKQTPCKEDLTDDPPNDVHMITAFPGLFNYGSQLPMRTSPKHNIATISLCERCTRWGATVSPVDAYLLNDHRRDGMKNPGFIRPGILSTHRWCSLEMFPGLFCSASCAARLFNRGNRVGRLPKSHIQQYHIELCVRNTCA